MSRRFAYLWSARRIALVAAGLLGLLGFLLEYGFHLGPHGERLVRRLGEAAVGLFLLELLASLVMVRPWRRFLAQRGAALGLAGLLVGELAAVHWGAGSWLAPFLRFFSIRSVTQAYLVVAQFYIVGNMLVHLPRLHGGLARRSVRPGVAFLLAFALLIAIGTGLLLLPRAVPVGSPLRALDALFTATSAVCVTGLIVRDTATQFTTEGQFIILLLIQLGGLGIMSLTATLSLFMGRGIGIRERSLLKEVLQIPVLGEVGRMLRFIVLFTFAAEALGAALLYAGFGAAIAEPRVRLYYAIFHAVSAFCNAGFSTFSDSLVGFAGDGAVSLTVAALLIVGGLGFTVVANLLAFLRGRALAGGRRSPVRLSVQTRLVLGLTAGTLVMSTLLLALLEWRHGFAGRAWAERLDLAFFQAATTRTAGFNTMDLTQLSSPALFMMVVLMFVGAGPGSTAGGVKLTTVGVMWANLRAIGRGLPEVRLFDRELPALAVRRAMLVLSGELVVVGVAIFLLLITEGAGLLETVFEAFSAMGTVGLSLGLTPELTPAGRVIVTVLMFAGRLGPLTLAYGLVGLSRERMVRLPTAEVLIG